MRTFGRFLRCYCRLGTFYRLEFYLQFVRDFLLMYCAYALWQALMAHGMGAEGMTRTQMLVYGVYGAIVTSFITRDGCQTYISQRIHQGTMDADLLKPIGLLRHMLTRDFAQKLSKLLLFTLPTLLIFTLLTRLFYLPPTPRLLLFLPSALLAYLTLFAINFLFGMLCFYTLSIENISFCYTAVVAFLAGQMVPLWMFPDWARSVVNLLPFRCIFDVPMSVYIGRLPMELLLRDVGLQAFWAAALLLAGEFAWRGIRKNVVSQGG